jgi:hypothetical protein
VQLHDRCGINRSEKPKTGRTARKGRKVKMKTRLLTTAMAVLGLFAGQFVAAPVANAKSSSAKKNHKKHMKKNAGIQVASPTVTA